MATNYNHFTQATASIPPLEGVAGIMITWLDWVLDVTNANGRKVADKVFSGSNKAVYRFLTGQRFYLRVDDAAAQETLVRVYETMTDVDTGVDPTPLVTTYASAIWRKSFEANGNNRDFDVVVWGRGIIFCVRGALNTAAVHELYGFYEPVREDGHSDPWNTAVIFRNATGTGATNGVMGGTSTTNDPFPLTQAGPSGFAMACVRNRAGTVKAPKATLARPAAASWGGQGYPDTPYLYRSHAAIASYQNATTSASNSTPEYRGHAPYLWGVASESSHADLGIDDVWTDTPYSGTFKVIKSTNTTTTAGTTMLLETTDSDPLVP